ncbi:MAG TPA: leucine--tRNA ligase [Chitinophagales bacterium]|nr:leucine--tRNA ligase [Chitinophagales bacterium]
MEYKFSDIEKKWQQRWEEQNTCKVESDPSKPKYYVLDMFPYPSGSGLHVGHPLGYIASDIFARYKKHCGCNVLHPMGFDAFGLPAEQYAIQTGRHPAVTTAENIKRFKEQLGAMGFSYDWSREVQTCDPKYYKWTQWIFLQLFKSWYNKKTDRAESIDGLVKIFAREGNVNVDAATDFDTAFSEDEWNDFSEKQQQEILMNYRLAYLSYAEVNWCPELGTVLANDEVKDGRSERGGYPVVKKKMRQWFLRITAYAERLLKDLDTLAWSDSMKEMQRNWIGRSEGALVFFDLPDYNVQLEIYTTRPDTIFGATFMVLAPEHPLVEIITTPEHRQQVAEYLQYVQSRSERERQAEVKKVTGAFTGALALNPFTGRKIPVFISEYVLLGYGTGAIMAVPSDDERDHAFATHFNLPIIDVIDKGMYPGAGREDRVGKLINSGFLDGMEVADAIEAIINEIERRGIGRRMVQYRLRDAIFGRQRYWGEPIPIYYKDDIPYPLDESELPLLLPQMDDFKPSPDGEPPLAKLKNWNYEPTTMPGWAGSSWYFLRYMDPHNDKEFLSKEAEQYWQDVDLYIGGTEHAVGHLLYARFWQKFLYDRGYVSKPEPFKRLVNQGMIQGSSKFVYRISGSEKYVSFNLKDGYEVTPLHVDVSLVKNDVLDIEAFKKWRPENKDAEFILEDGKYLCGTEIEKMSKSRLNVVNPDEIIAQYGADTFRMYEMFLGPIEQSKPWNTHGIDGVFKFVRKLWRLFYDESKFLVTDAPATERELKVLHKTIKKIRDDIERLSFNTCISTFMVCVNELTDLKCSKKTVLKDLVVLLAPFAPHVAEELWEALGNKGSVTAVPYPEYNQKYLAETTFEYPVSVNGKLRTKIELPLDLEQSKVQEEVLASDVVKKWLEGKPPKKVIYVPGKIINIVV